MLRAFYRRLRVKPKKIIMFRNGVSEGQFQRVTVLFSLLETKFSSLTRKRTTVKKNPSNLQIYWFAQLSSSYMNYLALVKQSALVI